MANSRYAPTRDDLSAAQGVTPGSDASDGWVSSPVAWDTVTVAGQVLPGLATVKPKRKYEMDKKRTAGADGATLTGFGHMPAEVRITLKLWTDEQFQRLKNVLPVIFPKPKKGRPQPVDVAHPALAAQGIRSLYFTDVEGPYPSGQPGILLMDLEATEFLPVSSSNVTNTPKQSAASNNALLGINAGAGGALPQPPVNPLDQLLSNGLLPPSQDPNDTGP